MPSLPEALLCSVCVSIRTAVSMVFFQDERSRMLFLLFTQWCDANPCLLGHRSAEHEYCRVAPHSICAISV